MKKCKGCGKNRSMDEYYAHPETSDGRLNTCKACSRLYMRNHRAKNPERVRAADKRKYEKQKQKQLAAMSRRREELCCNPEWQEKRKAQYAVSNAIRDGKLKRPKSCNVCGRTGRIEGHHKDYKKPLDVIWLCPPCHRAEHQPLLLPF